MTASTFRDIAEATLPPPSLPPDADVRLAPAAPGLWRVLRADGRVLGHLQMLATPDGRRYRARRFHAASRAFRDLGDFWAVRDALDCLRFAR